MGLFKHHAAPGEDEKIIYVLRQKKSFLAVTHSKKKVCTITDKRLYYPASLEKRSALKKSKGCVELRDISGTALTAVKQRGFLALAFIFFIITFICHTLCYLIFVTGEPTEEHPVPDKPTFSDYFIVDFIPASIFLVSLLAYIFAMHKYYTLVMSSGDNVTLDLMKYSTKELKNFDSILRETINEYAESTEIQHYPIE